MLLIEGIFIDFTRYKILNFPQKYSVFCTVQSVFFMIQ
nr:MAG TPA: hypothetical protein [Caudoviricetes sp.]